MGSRFSGKIVVVAGGTGGLGRAVSMAFLDEGAQVVVTDRKQEEFDSLRNAAGANAVRLEGRMVDVTDEDAVSRAIDGVVEQHGRLDVLVNAAGGYAGGANLWEAESKVLDQMLALNLRSGYALARAAVRVMLKQKQGAIVNVAAKAAFDHFPGAGAYVASKAAAVAMVDSLAAEIKGSGVRVNSILAFLPRMGRCLPNQKDVGIIVMEYIHGRVLLKDDMLSFDSVDVANESGQVDPRFFPVFRPCFDDVQPLAEPEFESHRHHHPGREQGGKKIALLKAFCIAFHFFPESHGIVAFRKAYRRGDVPCECVLLH